MKQYLLILLSLTLASCSQSMQSKNMGSSKLDTTMRAYSVSEAVAALDTYSADSPSVDAVYAAEKAKLFGIPQSPEDEGKVYRTIAGDLEVRVDKVSGSSFFQNRKKMWGADDRPFAVPLSDAEAEALATSYVTEHKLVKVPELEFFQVNKLTRVSNITKVKDVMEMEVVFKRKLNGRLVHGAGSQLSVFLGSDKQVHGVFLDWPELKKQKTVKLKDSKNAAADVKKALDEVNTRFIGEVKMKGFEVKHTRLEYAGTISPDGKRIIYPVYTLEGIKQIGDREEADILVVPASDELNLPAPGVAPATPIQLPGPTPQSPNN